MTAARRSRTFLVALVAIALALAAGRAAPTGEAASAAAAQEVPLEVTSATFSGRWKESFLIGGKIAFAGTVGGAANLVAVVRLADPPHTSLRRETLSTSAAGDFSGTLALPARPKTGRYVVRVTGTSGETKLAPAEIEVEIPAPPEGIVDRSSASRTENGPAIRRVKGPVKELWARFHFSDLPDSATVEVDWRTPQFTFVGAAEKSATENVTSFVRSTGALPKGVWYAFLRVNDKIAKRVAVRIT